MGNQENNEITNTTSGKKKRIFNKYLIGSILILVSAYMGYVFFMQPKEEQQNKVVQQLPDNFYNSEEQLQVVQNVEISDNVADYSKGFDLSKGFADLVDHVAPAVVNISVTKLIKGGEYDEILESIDPRLRDLFKNIVPNNSRQDQRVSTIGSGFVIKSDGFIVTNFHVVASAEKIVVSLSDGRKFDANIYASDPVTDTAVLKIDTTQLPTVKFGDSSVVRQGDIVITIGSPFGLEKTVSSGIISGIGRNIDIGLYNDFLQTDAAINKGNSGGPMINVKGEVIGMNTAIFSTSGGGSIGIGFAVPSNIVVKVASELIANKFVDRGWIGVQIQPVDENIKDSLGLDEVSGALIADVVPGGPAEKAGLKTGDVILEVNGKKINNSRELPIIVGNMFPGTKIILRVFSKKQDNTIELVLGKVQNTSQTSDNQPLSNLDETQGLKTKTFDNLGLQVAEINEALISFFNLPKDAKGIVIIGVMQGSVAESKGFTPSIRIVSVDQKVVNSIEEFESALKINKSKAYLFRVVSNKNSSLFLSISKEEIAQYQK